MRPPTCQCGECKKCKKRKYYQDNRGDTVSRATVWARENRDRHNKSVSSWKERNPDKVRSYWQKRNARLRGTKEASEIHRKYDLDRHYGVTPEWYETKLQEQGRECGICGCEINNAQNRRFHVDHSHETNSNRGLLCHRCNTALERLESVEDWADKAQKYLDKYENEWLSVMAKRYKV
jgi:hypothetical protein